MDIQEGFAIGFLGMLIAAWLVSQVSTLYRAFWPPTVRWLRMHIVLPRLFRGRHLFNPTRVELICHLLHWIATIVYNTYGVANLPQAASRAGNIAVVHLVPLMVSHQLCYVSQVLGLSLDSGVELHISMGLMATIQGALHTVIHLRMADGLSGSMVFRIMVRPLYIFHPKIEPNLP